MCQFNAVFSRYCYLNTVLHLMAMSYERYDAIVKSPLMYHGRITKSNVELIFLLWVFPIPLSISPLFGLGGGYRYEPDLFFCEQEYVVQSDSSRWKTFFTMMITAFLFVGPFLVIVYLNWSVYKTAKAQVQALAVQIGSLASSNRNQQEMWRRKRDCKAAVDVTIIVATFLLCYLPVYIARLLRWFGKSITVPAQAVLISSSVFFISSLCNPIIYSIRKREFRAGVKNVLRRYGLCGSSNEITEVIAMNTLRLHANLNTGAINPAYAEDHTSQDQQRDLNRIMQLNRLNFQNLILLDPIPETDEDEEL